MYFKVDVSVRGTAWKRIVKQLAWIALYLFMAFSHLQETREMALELWTENKQEVSITKENKKKEEIMKTEVVTTKAKHNKSETCQTSRGNKYLL